MLVPLEFAQYGITDRGRKDIIINLEYYDAALRACNAVIVEYNKTVKGELNDTAGRDAKEESNSK